MPKFQIGEKIRISDATQDAPQDALGREGVVVSLPKIEMSITRPGAPKEAIDLEAIYEVRWDALETTVIIKESDLTAEYGMGLPS